LLASFDPTFVDEVTKLARAIKQMDAAIDSESAIMRDMQERLKTLLRNHQARKVPGIVSWSSVKGRSGWDNKAIREAAIEAGVDLSPYATEGEPSDRLQITLKG
jgi:inhibitor of KinA sporulation pathway (predicted exonuclease)